jgi:hypothetical protein
VAERKIRGGHPELGSIHVVDSAEFVSLAAARDVIRRANERIAELQELLEAVASVGDRVMVPPDFRAEWEGLMRRCREEVGRG